MSKIKETYDKARAAAGAIDRLHAERDRIRLQIDGLERKMDGINTALSIINGDEPEVLRTKEEVGITVRIPVNGSAPPDLISRVKGMNAYDAAVELAKSKHSHSFKSSELAELLLESGISKASSPANAMIAFYHYFKKNAHGPIRKAGVGQFRLVS